MKSQDMILGVMRAQGAADALDLRGRAADMDGTAIIAEEDKVPAFDPAKDYSQWPAGAPVRDGEQVYKLITPHNAAHYPDSRPSNTPALWSITHTKDPARAKPWMPPKVTQIYNGKHPYQLIYVKGGGSTVYGWVDEKDIQPPALAAVDKLAKLGVINSPDYWKQTVSGGKVKYLDILLTKAAAKITKAGTRSATPEAGVASLVSAGVIDTPDYWLKNYNNYPSLGALLCALGGSV